MTIQEYVHIALQQIKNGTDEFNKINKEKGIFAIFPDKISFEICTDNEGCIGGPHKVIIEIATNKGYPYGIK